MTKNVLLQKLTSRKLAGAFGLVAYLLVQGTPADHNLAVVVMVAYMLVEALQGAAGLLASRPGAVPGVDLAQVTALLDTLNGVVNAFAEGATPPAAVTGATPAPPPPPVVVVAPVPIFEGDPLPAAGEASSK